MFSRLKQTFPSLSNLNLDNTNYNVRQQAKRGSMLLFVLKKLIQQLVLTPFYLLFIAPLLMIGFFIWTFRLSKDDKQQIDRYCQHYWYYPSLCIHKSIEGRYFGQMAIVSPSVDIGCEDGQMTALHYAKAVFDLGVEYIEENLPTSALFKRTLCGGLPHLPTEMNETYKTVSLVHVIDHIPDLPSALAGLKAVMQPNGRLYLSGLADGYLKNMQQLSIGLIAEKWLNESKGFYHFYSIADWNQIFQASGFKVLKIQGFLGGISGLTWTILNSIFETNGSNDLYYAANKLNLIPNGLKQLFFIRPACWITAVLYHGSDRHPCHFFAALELNADE